MADKLTPEQIESALAGIQSGETYFKHWLGRRYTEGVRYMAELCSAFWLINAIASHQPNPKIRKYGEFQVWTLKKYIGETWMLKCEDGNNNELTHQIIPFSDFPLSEITVWVENGVMLMPKEH
jgi:hypothetical protein